MVKIKRGLGAPSALGAPSSPWKGFYRIRIWMSECENLKSIELRFWFWKKTLSGMGWDLLVVVVWLEGGDRQVGMGWVGVDGPTCATWWVGLLDGWCVARPRGLLRAAHLVVVPRDSSLFWLITTVLVKNHFNECNKDKNGHIKCSGYICRNKSTKINKGTNKNNWIKKCVNK